MKPPRAMRSLLLPLAVTLGSVMQGCATNSIFPPRLPASFCDYPVTGALNSISVGDLETIAAMTKPHPIYGVEIANHNEVSVQITPTRHGSESLMVFKRTHGVWRMTDNIFRIASTSVATDCVTLPPPR